MALAACSSSGPAREDGATLQRDAHRAAVLSKSLGRFGDFALFEEEMNLVPCQVPLSEKNRTCDVRIVGKGAVRLKVADQALLATRRVDKDALVSVEYEARCDNQGFDFKTFDTNLPRGSSASPGDTVWESTLIKVTHSRIGEGDSAQCRILIEASPALIQRMLAAGDARND